MFRVVFGCHKKFREGRQNMEDDELLGLPSISRTEANVEKNQQIVREDRLLSVRMIAQVMDFNKDSVWKILHQNLNNIMYVPRVLTSEEKTHYQEMCCSHSSFFLKQFLAYKCITTVKHSPYSPYLAPCDLCRKAKSVFKGTRYELVDAANKETADVLKLLKETDLLHAFDKGKQGYIGM